MSLNINSLDVKVGSFALHIEELHVGPGEIVGLLGKSGSGKSTLLTALGGFIANTKGEYRIDGEDRSAFFPERRRLAYVFQKSSLFPHLTLERNVAFPMEIAGISRAKWRPRVRAWLDRLGLLGLAQRKPDALSGGEAQRGALARALVSGYKVVLLDEPFSALDPKLRRDLRVVVRELVHEEKLSVLWVTHDLEDAMVMDRVCILEKGKIVWSGKPAEIPREKYF